MHVCLRSGLSSVRACPTGRLCSETWNARASRSSEPVRKRSGRAQGDGRLTPTSLSPPSSLECAVLSLRTWGSPRASVTEMEESRRARHPPCVSQNLTRVGVFQTGLTSVTLRRVLPYLHPNFVSIYFTSVETDFKSIHFSFYCMSF